ncbi:MAG: trypsin-like peptidase domain-containing protein [Verrucomicrobiota bacterium]
MKLNSYLTLTSVCLGLLGGSGFVQASDPVKSLDDLSRLEAKVEAVSQKTLAATVALLSEETESSGSGVITTADGLILTAAHVTQGSKEVTVVFPNGEQVPGKVLGANYSKDISMVQIQSKGPWPFVEIGESKPLVAGDWVVAMGHSAGFDAARTPPVRFGRVVSKGPGNFLTTDCTLIGGDSGGPLFDLDGKIIGINSSIGVSLTNNNHAGVDGFKDDWNRLLAGESWGQLTMNPFANPEKPVLGIVMGLARGQNGVPVESLAQGSPAAAAGLRPGDVIISLAGSATPDGSRLDQVLTKRQAGETVEMGILRNNKKMQVEVMLARYDDIFRSRPFSSAYSEESDIPLMLPEEQAVVIAQDKDSSAALQPGLAEAAQSTVRIWSGRRRLAYGTVVGDGSRILTKWSEIARAPRDLRIDADGSGKPCEVAIAGIYEAEDLALLDLRGSPLTPVKWANDVSPDLGSFLAAPQPDGRLAGFGVVSVLERNLRDTDLAYLGILAEQGYTGPGVKISEVERGTGAQKAGLTPGNVILGVGERKISGLLALKNALTGVAPGEKVSLLVEANGREKKIDVALSNRPEMPPQYFGPRLQQMERMGGPISRVRDSFTHAIQTDMRLDPNQIGGPVVDLNGHVLGITVARADRTRSFIMPASAVEELLKTAPADPSLMQAKQAPQARAVPMAERGQPRIVPPAQPGQRPRSVPPANTEDRMRRHLSDMQRLMDYMQEEMDALENP